MGIFSHDEEPSWSDVIHLEEQVKELKAENERLKECNKELTSDNLNTIQEMDNERRRVEQLKQDIEAYKQSEEEASEIIAELKEEVRQLQRRNPEELYTLFGRPIKYWEQLEQENEKLKEEIKEVKKYQYEQEYLEKEIEEMQKALKTLAEGLNIRQQTLQEIKAIAEVPKPFIDFSETKTATEVGYDYAVICNELELRLHKVFELITKAEEE